MISWVYLIILIMVGCVILTKKPLTAITATLLLFIAVAVSFARMNKTYISLSIIIIYLGAILVLVVFVIMLTHSAEDTSKKKTILNQIQIVVCICVAVKIVSIYPDFWIPVLYEMKPELHEFWRHCLINQCCSERDLEEISDLLYGTETLIFLLCIGLLLISLIVCIFIIKHFKNYKKKKK